MKQDSIAIDIMKAVFSLCVIAIHTNPILQVNNQIILDLYGFVVSLAVPFFLYSYRFLGREEA